MTLTVRPMTKSSLLSGASNGKLPESILRTTPGQAGGAPVTLIIPASRCWVAMCYYAKQAGHTLKIGWPNSAYRPYTDQLRIFLERYTTTPIPTSDTKWWNGRKWYKRAGVAIAAAPGTSNHGWASAVDAGEENDSDAAPESFDDPTLRWLINNMERFGYSHELQSEPWHLRYNAGDNIPKAVQSFEAAVAAAIEDQQPTQPRRSAALL
jgi:hypothetical protein